MCYGRERTLATLALLAATTEDWSLILNTAAEIFRFCDSVRNESTMDLLGQG